MTVGFASIASAGGQTPGNRIHFVPEVDRTAARKDASGIEATCCIPPRVDAGLLRQQGGPVPTAAPAMS